MNEREGSTTSRKAYTQASGNGEPFKVKEMEEIWKDVIGYEENYQISNYGRLKLKEHKVTGANQYGAVFETTKNKGGRIIDFTERPLIKGQHYYVHDLGKDGKKKRAKIHRLVATHFVPNSDPETKTIVNHIDEDKTNNRADNLEWVDSKGNRNHGTSIERSAKNRNRAVRQVDKNTNETIEIFESVKLAGEKTNSHPSAIGMVCNGKLQTSNGFKWEWIKGEDIV